MARYGLAAKAQTLRRLSPDRRTATLLAALWQLELDATANRDLHPVTITKRAAAIAAAHRSQGQPSPCESPAIAAVLAGIRRTRGIRPQRKVQALELEPLPG